jgi:hypothetical protein
MNFCDLIVGDRFQIPNDPQTYLRIRPEGIGQKVYNAQNESTQEFTYFTLDQPLVSIDFAGNAGFIRLEYTPAMMDNR